MPETSRKLAKLIGQPDSLSTKLNNLLPKVRELVADSQALRWHSCAETLKTKDQELFPPQEVGGLS